MLEHEEFKNAHLTRQSGLIPAAVLTQPVHIVGAGAIGSFVALSLAKMGMTDITVYDYDTVSIENMSCQGYRFKDIGVSKVRALREIIEEYTNYSVNIHDGKWAPTLTQYDNQMRGIVINCADSMEVRKQLFDYCVSDFRVNWFIDSRMGAESALMYVMRPQNAKDQETYRKTLYSDKDAVTEPCTAKSTIYTANMLSGLVVKSVKDLLTRSKYPRVSLWSIKENALQVFSGEP